MTTTDFPDPATPSGVKALMARSDFRVKKGLGQNFLVDKNILGKIRDAVEPVQDDCIIEIGAGFGALTSLLAESGASVLAFEIDPALVETLRQTVCRKYENVRVIEADVLKSDIFERTNKNLKCARIKMAGNLPYYITTPVITKVLESEAPWERFVIMVQKEVADRIVAQPGTGEYGSLSVYARFYSEPEIVAAVSRNVFLPPPGVDSAIVRLWRKRPLLDGVEREAFFRLVRAAFAQRRKMLRRALRSNQTGLRKHEVDRILQEAGIAPERRGETLSVKEFVSLSKSWCRLQGEE